MLQYQLKPGSLVSEADRESADSVLVPMLKLTRNGITVQELSLDLPQILIGRNSDNDISIPSRYVSKRHIMLVRCGGSTILIDLNSTNGTFVNSERVNQHVLAHKDVITVDRLSMFVSYRIEYSEPSAIVDSQSDDAGPPDLKIAELLADFENLLTGEDTDQYPELSEDVPTFVGVIDDR